MVMTEANIQQWEYRYHGTENTDSPAIRLSIGHQRKLVVYIQYARTKYHLNGGALTPEQWLTLDYHDFDDYRVSPAAGTSPSFSAPNIIRASTAKIPDPAADFRKSIRREKTQYKEFRDEKYWDNWQRSFIVTARSHGLEHILNHSYVPATPPEQALFEEEQKFAYSVLEDCLQTDIGKTLVRQHMSDFDAQKVYKELCDHMTTSAKAKLASSGLLGYITGARYDSSWRGTAQSFILHWLNQLCQLDEMTAVSDRISEPVLTENKHSMSEWCRASRTQA